MLSNRSSHDAQLVEKGMTIDVGYYDVPGGEWHKIGTSDSYNWPQGCMLQWLPGYGNENKVIYNLSKNNHLIARIHDISTGENRDINWSIYGITPDGKKSIALNMERSYWCRAYHYESVQNKKYDVKVADEDGIFEIDLENNTRKRIISIQDIIKIDSEPYFNDCKHWLEHIMISPNGKQFCFLHRFSLSNIYNYETRLFIANIDGTNFQIIPNWRKYDWSHFGWNGENAFAIFSYLLKTRKIVQISKLEKQDEYKRQLNHIKIKKWLISNIPHNLKRYLLRIRDGYKNNYQYYSNNLGYFELKDTFKSKFLDIDGHPSFTSNHQFMITDSYPDYNHFHRLVIYNLNNRKSLLLGKIYAGLNHMPGSCDLHPKLCSNDKYLVVDTAYDGKHHMILFELNWELINKKIL